MRGTAGHGHRTLLRLFVVFAACICVTSLDAQSAAGSIVTRATLSGSAVVDAAGNLYQALYAGPYNQYPVTPGAAQTQPGGGTCLSAGGIDPSPIPVPCTDAYVVKVDAAGNTVFATYLGGQTNDSASTLAVDSAGNVYLAGSTGGSFPITPNAALPTISASGTFAAKLSADGSRTIYSTYLPSSLATAIGEALDARGNAYIMGKSAAGHVTIIKLGVDGSTVLYNRELAGTGQDSGFAIAVDAGGNTTVTGSTTSVDFPVSAGALQPRLLGPQNAFVTRLDANGNIVFSTYLGGSGRDAAFTVQSDTAGNIYVAGSTTSMDFPTTRGSFQPAPLVPMWAASPGGFVAKLNPDGSSLAYASYLMSTNGVERLALNSQGEAYLAGTTGAGFPVTASAPQACFGGATDVFVAHLDSRGALQDATYFGGPLDDNLLWLLAVAGDDSVLLVAEASLTGVRTPTFARIRFGRSSWTAPACLSPDVLNAATLFDPGRVAPGQISTLTGMGIGPDTPVLYQPGPQGEAPLSLAGVQVYFDDQPAPLIYVQSRQVNVMAPFELTGSTSTNVRLVYNGASFGPFAAPVFAANPSFFRLQPGVSTQAAAINQDGTINGPDHPATVGSVVSLYGTGFGQTDPSCTTGALNAPVAANLALGVTVTINGSGAAPRVEYAGGAPTLLCGVVQVNVVVPIQTPSGPFGVVPWWQRRIGGDATGVQNNIGATIVVK